MRPLHPSPPTAAPGRHRRGGLRLLAAVLASLLTVVGLAPLAQAEPDYTFDPTVLAGEGEVVYDSPTAVGIFTVTATGERYLQDRRQWRRLHPATQARRGRNGRLPLGAVHDPR